LELVTGKLPEGEVNAVTAHISQCPACEQTIVALEEASSTCLGH
jgi:anti-sigma factor RsiW